MKYSFVGVIIWGIVLLIGLAVIAGFITLLFFGIKALKKYLKTKEVREEKATIKKSLGEVIKQHREECKMTQEFVAEAIGVITNNEEEGFANQCCCDRDYICVYLFWWIYYG